MYIQLILGEKCNINCKYCHLGQKRQDSIIQDNIILNLIEKIKIEEKEKENSEEILLEFQGGEPLLYFKKIKKIIKLFKKEFGEKVKFIITSNGTVLNNEILFFLIQNKNSISLNISFDGTDYITTENRTKNKEITKIILNNIRTILNKKIKLTIIGTINKNWVKLTNNNPEKIKEFLGNEINKYSIFKEQVSYFFRPEILLTKDLSYGIEPEIIINFHKQLSKIIDNEYYKIKKYLIEFNKQAEKNTICIDYDGTLYPNDYFKSYIKRFKNKILKNYTNIFSIFNSLETNTFNYFIDNLEVTLKQYKTLGTEKFIENLLKNFNLDLNYFNINQIEEIKNIFIELLSLNLKGEYFIFNLNPETNYIYKNI